MAQTRRRRRRKQRGTQGGRVDTRSRSRPRTRAEVQARAGARRRTPRGHSPPTWQGAAMRGLLMSAIFVAVLLLLRRPPLASMAFGAFMLLFYIPMGYYIDRALWRRRERQRMRGAG